jgi:DNA-binding transcriptional LysR family regulator
LSDEKLKSFIAVARSGNITQAAKELHISQPALTSQIHKLEKEYSEILFYRRVKGVELTPSGKLLYDYALRINSLYEEISETLGVQSGETHGILHLGATFTIGEYLLPQIMGRFKNRFPYVDLLLEIENTHKVVEEVANGNLDFGLVEGPFENGLIRSEKLTDDELVVVCSVRNKLANISELDLDTLYNQPFILREQGSGTRQVFEDALIRAGIDLSKIRVIMQLGSTHMIKSLVAENIGMTVISERTVREELKQGVLKRLKVPALNLGREFVFTFKKGMNLSYIHRQFVAACRQFVDGTNML